MCSKYVKCSFLGLNLVLIQFTDCVAVKVFVCKKVGDYKVLPISPKTHHHHKEFASNIVLHILKFLGNVLKDVSSPFST